MAAIAAPKMTAAGIVDALGLVPHPEGGFFLETHRTGATPMTTMGQTKLDAGRGLVVTDDRPAMRPDGDARRNALTSIFWMPTRASPVLLLAINASDHVHYWQGGGAFEYTLFDPVTKELSVVVLGSDIRAGQRLQVPVRGGTWKCGRLLLEEGGCDFCLVGEAVAPGFDFNDFAWCTEELIGKEVSDAAHAAKLRGYLHENIEVLKAKEATMADAESFYGDQKDEAQKRLV